MDYYKYKKYKQKYLLQLEENREPRYQIDPQQGGMNMFRRGPKAPKVPEPPAQYLDDLSLLDQIIGEAGQGGAPLETILSVTNLQNLATTLQIPYNFQFVGYHSSTYLNFLKRIRLYKDVYDFRNTYPDKCLARCQQAFKGLESDLFQNSSLFINPKKINKALLENATLPKDMTKKFNSYTEALFNQVSGAIYMKIKEYQDRSMYIAKLIQIPFPTWSRLPDAQKVAEINSYNELVAKVNAKNAAEGKPSNIPDLNITMANYEAAKTAAPPVR